MSNWSGGVLTNVGRELQLKVEAGATLTFTKIKLGDGIESQEAVDDLTDLMSPKFVMGISSKSVANDVCKITGVLSSSSIATGFRAREWGLFAQDPDIGEILYMISIDTQPDWVPSGSDIGKLAVSYAMNVAVSNASSITARIDPAGLVTADMLAELIHETQYNKSYNVGDYAFTGYGLPAWAYLECIQEGISGTIELDLSNVVEGEHINDGTVVWIVRNWHSIHQSLVEATGYGIVSGCEPSISGLTVAVGEGIVHLSDGTRKEIAETNITLDSADSGNPRIDLVYITSAGEVAKITGTASASPVVPSIPSSGISVANVSVAAGASTGTLTDKRYYIVENTLVTQNKNLYKKLKKYQEYVGITNHSQNHIQADIDLGVGIIRMDAFWQNIETSQGVYNLTATVNWIKSIYDKGVTPQVVVGGVNSLYQSVADKITGYTAFATALVTAVVNAGVTGIRYELMNEPNAAAPWNDYNNYTNAVKSVYLVIKALDNSATVITHSTANFPTGSAQFIRNTLLLGIADYTDIISVHPYTMSNKAPESVNENIELQKKVINEFTNNLKNGSLKLCNGEQGYSILESFTAGNPSVCSEAERAKYIPRMILNGIANDLESVNIYCDYTGSPSSDITQDTNTENWFGVYSHWAESETTLAIKALSALLHDKAYAGVVFCSETATVMQFLAENGEITYVGWTTKPLGENIILNGNSVHLTDSASKIIIDNNIPSLINRTYANMTKTNAILGDIVDNNATGKYSIVGGFQSKSTGLSSIAIGQATNAFGDFSVSLGAYNLAGQEGYALGVMTFTGGNSASYKITGYSGNTITLESIGNIAVNDTIYIDVMMSSTVIAKVTAINGTTLTLDKTAQSSWRYVVKNLHGVANIALGMSSASLGTYSTAIGVGNVARQWGTMALGTFNTNGVASSTSLGKFSKETTSDDALRIGNGYWQNSLTDEANFTRNNCFRVTFGGATYTAGAYNTGGADYAEFFEWNDGNAQNEDRVGYFVTFDSNNKIRLANSDDAYLLGITSGNPATLGNSYSDSWERMYVTDDFGRVQYETVEMPDITNENGEVIVQAHIEKRPMINPEYDNTQEYIGRENRKEWSAVGMLGVLPVRDDGTCAVNGYCKVDNGGIATKADNGYRVIERVSDNVVKIVFR